MTKPICPHCGNDKFREELKIGAERDLIWNEEIKKYEYGSIRYYKDEIETNFFICDKCERPIDYRILKEWID